MPLHSIAVHGANSFEIVIVGDETDYVVLDEFDLPTAIPIVLGFRILATFTIDSSVSTIPALSFAGLHADSQVYLDTRAAFVRGAGGAGGSGGRHTLSGTPDGYGGGGGGGAGSAGGAGGETFFPGAPVLGEAPGTAGVVGTAGTGGVTGSGSNPSEPDDFDVGTSGDAGGTAIITPCELIITNAAGFILAGGGGGAPGLFLRGSINDPGTDGGLEGQPGVDAGYPDPLPDVGASSPPVAGTAGYAIRHTGVGPTWISGNGSPNVEGLIG